MLETKITELTAAVSALTAKLDAIALLVNAPTANAPTATAPTPTPTDKPETTQTEQVTFTRDNLQKWALAKVRSEPAFKDVLKAALAEHNAKTISQLPDDATAQTIYKALGGVL